MPDDTKPAGPPRARVAFRVGVVGHRPNRLDDANEGDLTKLLRTILTTIKGEVVQFASSSHYRTLYSDAAPILRAISPLAEGTDRLFAKEALDLGFELCCPMPFSQPEFEQDFVEPHALEANSLATFRELLARARGEGDKGAGLTIFELDGDHDRAADAYGAAGRIVVNQSDLIIVVWDGEPPAGGGGTVETLHAAMQYHVPVVWIDAVAPHPWRLLRSQSDFPSPPDGQRYSPRGGLADYSAVQEIVRGQLEPPLPIPNEDGKLEEPLYHDYFAQRQRWWNWWFVWKLFRNLVGSWQFSAQRLPVDDYVRQIQSDWPTDAPTTAGWVNAKLRAHYGWSDKPADIYADGYRSSYVLVYLLAAAAVVLALLPMALGLPRERQAPFVASELVILTFIIGLVYWGRRRRWHEHWMEYRLLAEHIRQLRFLIPLGGGRPLPHIPPQLEDYGDPTRLWTYWHVLAVARETGIPNVRVTQSYLRECLDYIEQVIGRASNSGTPDQVKVIGGQYAFHDANARRSDNIRNRLHHAALWLLILTVGAVLLHLFHAPGLPHEADGWLTLASAALPALGAALAGIENQGEFTRVAKRSRAMAKNFARFASQIARLKTRIDEKSTPPVSLAEVTRVASDVAQLMVDEVADWRVVFRDREQKAAA